MTKKGQKIIGRLSNSENCSIRILWPIRKQQPIASTDCNAAIKLPPTKLLQQWLFAFAAFKPKQRRIAAKRWRMGEWCLGALQNFHPLTIKLTPSPNEFGSSCSSNSHYSVLSGQQQFPHQQQQYLSGNGK
jgi:hypothetical protein